MRIVMKVLPLLTAGIGDQPQGIPIFIQSSANHGAIV
jgi:hypothetical protein